MIYLQQLNRGTIKTHNQNPFQFANRSPFRNCHSWTEEEQLLATCFLDSDLKLKVSSKAHCRPTNKTQFHDQNPRSATAEQRRSNGVFPPRVESATIVSSEAHCRSEWVLGVLGVKVSSTSESVFWSILECFFYLFGVRVMENIEVGYGALTVRITGG